MKIRNFSVLLGALAVLAATAAAAYATHAVVFSYAVNPTKAGAVTSSTASMTVADAGSAAATEARFHLAPGTLVAHANDATSPVSPPPINGDIVGNATIVADPTLDGCGNPLTIRGNATWIEPVATTAPSGSVAQVRIRVSLLFTSITINAFITKSTGDALQAAPHYDLVATGLNSGLPAACAGSSAKFTVVTNGNALTSSGRKTTRITQKNPSTAGTKTVFVNYSDTAGASHTGSATYTVTP